MQIKTLILKDFGPHAETKLDLAPVNFFGGQNGQGKTFILDALHVLRFGTTRELEVAEAGMLTRAGARGWKIEATIGDKTIQRTKSSGPSVGELDFILGPARSFRALFEVEHFSRDCDAKQRRELVAGLVGKQPLEIIAKLEEAGCTNETVKEAVRLGNMRRAHAAATDERRAASRDLAAAKGAADAPVEDPQVETSKGAVVVSSLKAEQILAAYDKARGNLSKAEQAAGAADAAAATIAAGEEASHELETVGAGPTWSPEDGEARKQAGRVLDGARELLGAARGRHNDREGLAARLSKVVEAKGGECPTCGGSLAERKVAAKKALEAASKESAEAAADVLRLTTEVKTAEEALKKLVQRQKEAEAWATRKAYLEEKVAAAKTALASDAGTGDLEKARADFARVDRIRIARALYDGGLKTRSDAAERVPEVEGRVAKLEAIVEIVRPDQVPDEKVLLERLNVLMAETAAQVLPTGKCPVLTETWDLVAEGRPLSLLSKSEQMRAGFCCAVALTVVSGRKVLVFDDLEALVGPARVGIFTVLRTLVVRGDLETAFLCMAAKSREEVPVPKSEMMRSWWVEGGKVEAVKAS